MDKPCPISITDAFIEWLEALFTRNPYNASSTTIRQVDFESGRLAVVERLKSEADKQRG